MAHIREAPPNAADLNPNVPVHLDRILQKILSKEPASRYRTADQLGRILISYRRQGHVTTDQLPQVPSLDTPPETAPTLPPTGAPLYNLTPGQVTHDYQSSPPTLSSVQSPVPAPEIATSTYPRSSYTSAATSPGIPAVTPSQYYQPPRAPDALLQSRYRATEPPQQLDLVTLALAFLAFIAVVLLIPLWIAVYQAWLG
jgi:hypothetical protein